MASFTMPVSHAPSPQAPSAIRSGIRSPQRTGRLEVFKRGAGGYTPTGSGKDGDEAA
jgi:hypothetical protein